MSRAEAEKSPVAIPCVGYEEMAVAWRLLHSLLGGTQAMRDAGQEWLPMEPAESVTSYNSRIGRAILYNGYRDTSNKLKNRPFTHPITVTDIPEELDYLKEDVDGTGKSLETFIKEVLNDLIQYGVAHIYVDHSVLEAIVEGKELSKADEMRLGARVYLTNISPANLIGWQSAKESKAINLTQIRTKESVTEASGDYGDTRINYINVYNIDSWERHKQDEENEDKYTIISKGQINLGKIPLVTIYANQVGFMLADPPLLDLAWLNLAHWQSYSDQRNILRFSRFGLLFGKGMPKNLVETGSLEIGPTKAILVQTENADLKYVEHNGQSIEAGRKDLEDIEQKMRVLGNQPLMKDMPDTATAERLDEGRTVSQLQSWVRALERGIIQALQLACEWRAITPKETMKVDIYSDFEAVVLGSSDKDLLLKMRQAGEITGARLLREEQRRGVFSQDMNPEDEHQAALLEETESMADLVSEEDGHTEDDDAALEE